MIRFALFLSLLLLPLPAFAKTNPSPVRVRLETTAGNIVLELNSARAPKTVRNFMTYVDDGRLDGTLFYRASRSKTAPGVGFIQGGIGTDPRRKMTAVPFESTKVTGLSHIDGALSMARGQDEAIATCNFSIMVGAHPYLNASNTQPGYAVFGRIAGGMDVVKRIMAMPTGGGVGPMRGQMILKPVIIRHAVRLNGTAHPSGLPKSWLIELPHERRRR